MSDGPDPRPALLAWYRSDEHDLGREFYVPCLLAYDRYDRAAGYFTSSAFPILANGLEAFIERAGQMRMVCSPALSRQDAAAISQGYEAREETVGRSLLVEIEEAGRRFEEATAILAWMVADGSLDIKLAVPSEGEGIYHEKFGIFGTDRDDFVAFMGSPNETRGGVLWNFEQIAVFVAGESDRETGRVADLRKAFQRLWSDETRGLRVIPFPEAARQALIRYRPPHKPRFTRQERPRFELFDHQAAAVKAWKEAGDRGIFEMATGTGKTLAALAAAYPLAESGKLVVVLVPGLDLLDQWADVIRHRIPNARVITCGGRTGWAKELSDFLSRWRIQSSTRMLQRRQDAHFVIGTLDTAATNPFLNRFAALDERSVLIVDEVHRAGSRFRRRALEISPRRRLGLSATPIRQWDRSGQQAIDDGVGPVVYRYELKDAIRDGYLTPYEYRPRLVSLSEDEREQFQELSDEIQKRYSILSSTYPHAAGNLMALLEVARPDEAEGLEILLYRRADVLKETEAKLDLVRELARDSSTLSCLVYCNDEEQVGGVVGILKEERRSYGVFTTARLRDEQRKVVLRDFADGRFDFLTAIRCLDEGVDIPGASHALILASSRNEREFIQRRGRVLRRAPGKDRSVIHDPIVVPFTLDADGYPASPLREAEQLIISRELQRAELFIDAAENSLEAMSRIHRIRELVRMASEPAVS
jgi:superfamily II DNA or RNA helicase